MKTKILKTKEGIYASQLDYQEENGETKVLHIKTYPNFRNNGYATKLLQSLQREVGDKDINFDLVLPESRTFIEKIANVEKTVGQYGGTYYKGRVKL